MIATGPRLPDAAEFLLRVLGVSVEYLPGTCRWRLTLEGDPEKTFYLDHDWVLDHPESYIVHVLWNFWDLASGERHRRAVSHVMRSFHFQAQRLAKGLDDGVLRK